MRAPRAPFPDVTVLAPLTAVVVTALLIGAHGLAAQSIEAGDLELPEILSLEREIALARSAAPPEVSGDATVLALRRGIGYEVVVEGESGVTCMVDRSWARAIEPICYDAEGSESILPIRLHFARMREAGHSRAEIETDRDAALASGRLRAPDRPALIWMVSAAQELYADDGRPVGSWKPHLMIYYPGMTEEALGLPETPLEHGPWLSDAGLPTATLVVAMPDFVHPDESATGR